MRQIVEAYTKNPSQRPDLIEAIGSGIIQKAHASGSPINRYTVSPGKIYGNKNGNVRYKILRVSGDMVFYKDLHSERVSSMDIDDLLPAWSNSGVYEITFLDDLINNVRKILEPALGPFIMGALTAWLLKKLN